MFNKVVFDCDSTLTQIEGIDELAGIKGKYEQVQKLTQQAMGGEVSFEQVFGRRLEMIRPEKQDLLQVGKLYIKHCLPEAKSTITQLQKLQIQVYLVSGGYDAAVQMLAKYLGINSLNVFANHLIFDKQGKYQDFDKTNPLCQDNGKKQVLQLIKQAKDRIMFVGDAMTDFTVNGAVDLFVGFGGVVERPALREKAPVYITCLTKVLQLVNDK